jgi:hypothetical protein
MDTCRLVLPPAESDFVEMASTPPWKLDPVPLPIDRVVVVPVVPVVPVVLVPDSPVMELASPPQPASNTAPRHATIDNLRIRFLIPLADERP